METGRYMLLNLSSPNLESRFYIKGLKQRHTNLRRINRDTIKIGKDDFKVRLIGNDRLISKLKNGTGSLVSQSNFLLMYPST